MVAHKVKNCATTKRTLDAISLSFEINREVNDKATAVMNEATAMPFSRCRFVIR